MALADACASTPSGVPVVSEMTALNAELDTGITATKGAAPTKQLANLQSDETLLNYRLLSGAAYNTFPLLNDLSDQDDQYAKLKAHTVRLDTWEGNLSLLADSYASATSYVQVFNNFPSTFEDYGWVSSLNQKGDASVASSELLSSGAGSSEAVNLVSNSGASSSASDAIQLRPSVKDSIVNNNAFQKVFRSRLDEGRAHVNASHFSNLAQGQPFIGDYGVPYTDLLGKNRTSYFSTPYYVNTLAKNFNTLSSVYSLTNTQMFEFPFMDAVKSDLIRYT